MADTGESGSTESAQWRRCSACKKPIPYGSLYYSCSVSTCNRKRTALFFCTVSCWEVHLPVARHREAWAAEQTAPSRAQAEAAARQEAAGASRPRKRIIAKKPGPVSGGEAPEQRPDAAAKEVLIIASRLKEYIRATSGYNTSDRVLEPLSEIVREVCDRAVRSAAAAERRTVLDRDIKRP